MGQLSARQTTIVRSFRPPFRSFLNQNYSWWVDWCGVQGISRVMCWGSSTGHTWGVCRVALHMMFTSGPAGSPSSRAGVVFPALSMFRVLRADSSLSAQRALLTGLGGPCGLPDGTWAAACTLSAPTLSCDSSPVPCALRPFCCPLGLEKALKALGAEPTFLGICPAWCRNKTGYSVNCLGLLVHTWLGWFVSLGGHTGLCLGFAPSLCPLHASSNREQMATKRKWTWELDIGGLSLSGPHFPPKAKNIYVPSVVFLFVSVWATHVGAQG